MIWGWFSSCRKHQDITLELGCAWGLRTWASAWDGQEGNLLGLRTSKGTGMGSRDSAVTHPILPCLQVTVPWLRMDTEVVAACPRIPVPCPPNCGCYMWSGFLSATEMGPSIFSLPLGTRSWWDFPARFWPPVPTPHPTGNLFSPWDTAVL